MRGTLSAAIMLGLLAACSADHSSPDSAANAGALPDVLAGKTAAGVSSPQSASMRSSYAGLPDRGELLRYDPVRSVRHAGAYTAYPVALSEAHALNAMRTGELVINAPNGEAIRLSYERHVEHPDGNWSWIGRDANGTDAVITFGEKAVYGSIPQGAADSLRLTMSAGQSYLVATDRSKLAGTSALRRSGTDQMVPPKGALTASSGRMSTAALPPTAAAATASGPIDVLLGYTAGFAQAQGSASAAVTRLVNLVDVANQAYANSGVTRRARLVGTLQVNYADDTDNGDALESLTGYRAGDNGGPIDTDSAFDALREMRDETGADLVSLVRDFRTPENNGCGIAWLIGGDQSSFTSADEGFGYSVVSDGVDMDEGDGNSYFCRDETLAHEMGHNMGQAHNEEDAGSSGVHPYSYGYREAASNGFYTVMAYPQQDGDQFSIRNFANPDKTSNGRPTGVANASDNVRSMNITMPIVAAFRDAVEPAPGTANATNDFNGDGKSDILWRNSSSGENKLWRSGNSQTAQSIISVGDVEWKVAGVGDFNADGSADILWRNARSGRNVIWRSGSSTTQQALATVGNPAWKIVGVGDFDGNGKSDILWRNTTTGQNLVWKDGSANSQQSLTRVANLAWDVVGVGDFDGDGKSDILWRNASSGQNQIWPSGSTGAVNSLARVNTQAWKVFGVADFNLDGEADILWRNDVSGDDTIWLSGSASSQRSVVKVGLAWTIVGVGDFNGDGTADILWRNLVNGQNTIWNNGSPNSQTAVTTLTPLSWQAVGF